MLRIKGFANMSDQYKVSSPNNHLVDKYYNYINSELKEKDNLQKSTNEIREILDNIKAVVILLIIIQITIRIESGIR